MSFFLPLKGTLFFLGTICGFVRIEFGEVWAEIIQAEVFGITILDNLKNKTK